MPKEFLGIVDKRLFMQMTFKQELLHYVFIMRGFPATNGWKLDFLMNLVPKEHFFGWCDVSFYGIQCGCYGNQSGCYGDQGSCYGNQDSCYQYHGNQGSCLGDASWLPSASHLPLQFSDST